MKRCLAAACLLTLPLAGAEECKVPHTPDLDTVLQQDVQSAPTFFDKVDDFQSYWSHRMKLFSSNVDQSIYSAFTDAPEDEAQPTAAEQFFLLEWFDSYFTDQTYFDPCNKSYIRLLGGIGYGSKSGDSWYTDIRARVMVPRSKDRLQIFIGDETKTSDELASVASDTDHSGIGLRYLRDFFSEQVRTSFSVGVTSIDNPYARARVGYSYIEGHWMLQPVQTFRYSEKNEFEEWTNLTIARKLQDKGVGQLLLQRSTRSGEKGMEYLAELAYREINRHNIGLKPYVALYGRTKDQPHLLYDTGERVESGIYNYATGLIWKRPVLRDYIFLQLHPGVEFHERYDYEADYIMRLTMEFFIGDL